MPKTLSLLLLLCATLNCRPPLDLPQPLQMPASMAVDDSVPYKLKLGDIGTKDGMVLLTPEQAAKLAAQVKYFRGQMTDQYLLGRREGELVVDAMMQQLAELEQDVLLRDRWWVRACVGALLLGVGTGAALYHTLDH
jgi:hypothetical protein